MRNEKITPLYERLSQDDELQGESSSISNHNFICRTSRCVCRCGSASAPEHHPLCDRQAASPGEYDIPDDLPNRRTGHGHGLKCYNKVVTEVANKI